MQIENRVIATAGYFVERGARVALFDLNREAGETAVAELGGDNALFCPTDVTSEESVQAAVDGTMEKFSDVRIQRGRTADTPLDPATQSFVDF